jgi:hypothetical protein
MGSTFAPSKETEALIETSWRRAGSRPGVNLFDGPMCRLESVRANSDALTLSLSRTSYKQFLGTNMAHSELPRSERADPVGLSCALESADAYLLLGRRNDRVAYYPSRLHPFAGALEPGESGPPDVFAEVHRELDEELSMTPAEVAELACVALIEDHALRQPELIFLARSHLTRREIEGRLDPGEHDAIVAVVPQEAQVEELLAERERMTPVCAGAVLLWALPRFGPVWLADARVRLGVSDAVQKGMGW